jgi:hypothetical protein
MTSQILRIDALPIENHEFQRERTLKPGAAVAIAIASAVAVLALIEAAF